MELIKYLIKNIDEWLDGNGIGSYSQICTKVKEVEEKLVEYNETELTTPKGRRKKLDFEKEIHIPFLNEFKKQISAYFGEHFKLYAKFEAILPQSDKSFENIRPLFQFYIDNHIIGGFSMDQIQQDFELYKIMTKDAPPDTEILKLYKISKEFNLNSIAALLQILLTIGGSSATAERCFSALQYIKNKLRNAIDDERLDSLISIYFNSEVECNENDVITEYGKTQHRYDFNFSS